MKHPLRRCAARCRRQSRRLFGHVQACAGRLGAAALCPSVARLWRFEGDAPCGPAKPVPRVPRIGHALRKCPTCQHPQPYKFSIALMRLPRRMKETPAPQAPVEPACRAARCVPPRSRGRGPGRQPERVSAPQAPVEPACRAARCVPPRSRGRGPGRQPERVSAPQAPVEPACRAARCVPPRSRGRGPGRQPERVSAPQAPVEPAVPGHRVRPPAKQGGRREAAQGGISHN
jgi:hypothetical protein